MLTYICFESVYVHNNNNSWGGWVFIIQRHLLQAYKVDLHLLFKSDLPYRQKNKKEKKQTKKKPQQNDLLTVESCFTDYYSILQS